jgi:hypothetical protein
MESGDRLMALTPRQKRFYTDRVNLYAPIMNRSGSILNNPLYPETPTIANVPCKYFSTPNTEMPMLQGRTKVVNIFTLDVFHFEADCPVDDTWMIEMITPGSPKQGQFWYVQGDVQVRANSPTRTPNKAEVYAKQGPLPANRAARQRRSP